MHRKIKDFGPGRRRWMRAARVDQADPAARNLLVPRYDLTRHVAGIPKIPLNEEIAYSHGWITNPSIDEYFADGGSTGRIAAIAAAADYVLDDRQQRRSPSVTNNREEKRDRNKQFGKSLHATSV